MIKQNTQAFAALSEMRSFYNRIESLMAEVDDARRGLSHEKKQELQDTLKELKVDLKSASKRPAGNRFESAFSNPAITEASVHITARVNSHPVNSNWFSSLYDASVDLSYMIHQLEDYVKNDGKAT